MRRVRAVNLFDGISVGRLALDDLGLEVEKYYAFEVDPYAIQISKKNYSDIIQCGDVFGTDYSEFIDKGINLVMGGSPCTEWSKAKNNRELDITGKGYKLFMQYAKAVHTIKPTYFLYENNYGMSVAIEDAISNELGVAPIMIDSALVSVQSRKRLYWTNIPNVKQPKDRGLVLRDIYVPDESLVRVDKRIFGSAVHTKNYIRYDISGKGHYSQQDRLYFLDGKMPTIARSRTESKCNILIDENDISRYKILSSVEAERGQTLPDNYTDCVSKTRRFQAIGNAWTKEVIVHILKNMRCA